MPIDKLSANAFATGAVANSLGYTPANKAGDTFTGNVVFSANATVTGAAAFSNTVTVDGGFITPHTGFKNRIINGDMRISQRNVATATSQVHAAYNLDRFWGYSYNSGNQTGKYTVAQSSTAPAGFLSSLLVTSSAATSISANDLYSIGQHIEGLNTGDLAWGTASASSITLSFWVRCSLTGTFGGIIKNQNNNYNYPFQFTISSANTFEYKTITISGPTSGTWQTDSSTGLTLSFNLQVGTSASLSANGTWQASGGYGATGCVNVLNTSGATFYLTGVQLEKGSTATAFDYRPVGSELQLCQRYYEKSYNQEYVPGTFNVGWDGTSTNGTSFAEGPGPRFKVSKRVNPTVVIYNAVSGATARMYQVSTAASITVAMRNIGHNGVGIVDYTSSGGQNSYYFQWTADAEL